MKPFVAIRFARLLVIVAVLVGLGTVADSHAQIAAAGSAGITLKPAAVPSRFRAPISFEANVGQGPSRFAFVSHGQGYSAGIAANEFDLRVEKPSKPVAGLSYPLNAIPQAHLAADLALRLLGSDAQAKIAGLDQASSRANYFLGKDQERWHANVAQYESLKSSSIYPGIDLLFHGNLDRLEYDFALAPGSDPSVIKIAVSGSDKIRLDPSGDLRLSTSAGDVVLKRPEAYQQIAGGRQPVESRFRLNSDSSEIAFEVGAYDRSQPLVIDPVLTYSTIIDGNFGAEALGLTVDANGEAYIVGNSCSADFPDSGTLHAGHNADGNFCEDAFVQKFDASGNLLFSDTFGGAAADSALRVALDTNLNIYITGITGSPDFPTTVGAMKASIGTATACPIISQVNAFCFDGFAVKLSADGTTLIYSTLMGGSDIDAPTDIKVDSLGNAYIVGITGSSDFVPAANGLQTAQGGGTCGIRHCFDVFLLKLNPTGTAAPYMTFFGGNGDDSAIAEALDANNNVYLAGSTYLDNTGLQTTTKIPPSGGVAADGADVWVLKFNISSTPGTLIYSSVVSGELIDAADAIAIDSNGDAYVTGATVSQHFPTTTGVVQANNQAGGNDFCSAQEVSALLPAECGNAFLFELNPAGTALVFSTFLGGTGPDAGTGVARDSHGNIWLTGFTSSSSFPVTAPPQGTYYPAPTTNTTGTGYLTELNPTGTQVLFSTMLGPASQGVALAIDGQDNAYVTGTVSFPNEFPETPNIYEFDTSSSPAAFLQKWSLTGQQPIALVAPTALTFGDQAVGTKTASQPVTITNNGPVPMQIGVRIGSATGIHSTVSDFVENDNCGSSLAANASCTANVTFEPQPICNTCFSNATSLVVLDNAPGTPHVVTLSGAKGTGPTTGIIPNPVVFPTQAAGQASLPIDVNINNAGDINLDVSSITFTGPNASEFAVTGTPVHPCLTAPVGPTTSCDFMVTFSPASNATGTRTASIAIADNAAVSPQTIPVSGTIAVGASLTVSPVSPPAIALGPNVIGSANTPPDKILALTNAGTADIQVTALTLGGTNLADFNIIDLGCPNGAAPPFTVAKGTSCEIGVTFAPASGTHGLRQATLTIVTSPSVTLPVLSLTGDAVVSGDAPMTVFAFPSPMDFGAVPLGQTTNPLGAIVSIGPGFILCGVNPCAGALTINNVSVTTGGSEYKLIFQGATPPFTFGPTTSNFNIDVTFTPNAAGTQPGVITIQSNDPQGNVTIPLTGVGLAFSNIQLSPPALQFGQQTANTASSAALTITNIGTANLLISAIASTDPRFAIQSNGCTAAVPPNQSCVVSLAFTPTSAVNFSGALNIMDNTPSGLHVVSLSGLGTSIANTTSSAPSVTTLTSTSNPAGLAQQFLFIAKVTSSVSGTPSGSVSFFDGTTSIGQNSLDATGQTFVLSQSLTPGAHTITASYSGDTRFLTSTSTTLLQTITSTRPTINPNMTMISSANPSAAGQSVTFTTKVSATSGGTPSGLVTFVDDQVPVSRVALDGTGTATFATSTMPAGTHAIYATYLGDSTFLSAASPTVTQKVNAGSGTTLTSTTTALTSSANPSTSDQSVTFTATVTSGSGTPTGSVTFADASTGNIGTGTLNGSGVATFSTTTLAVGSHSITAAYSGDANFAASTSSVLTQTVSSSSGTPSFTVGTTGPTSQTVTAGGNTSYSMIITPVNSSTQTVTLSCTGAPSLSTCTPASTSVTLNGASTSTVVVNVTTTAAVASSSRPGSDMGLLALAVVGGLLSWPRVRRASGVLLMTLLLGLIVACGGGGGGGGTGGNGGNPGTPKGTYTLTLTGTSGGATQTATVTLVVQ